MNTTKTTVRWNIKNNLDDIELEITQYRRGESSPRYEKLSAGKAKTYQSIGEGGRIELRVKNPRGFRVEFGKNDFPGWIEINPKDQGFNTLMFPNGGKDENNYNDKNVTVHPPE